MSGGSITRRTLLKAGGTALASAALVGGSALAALRSRSRAPVSPPQAPPGGFRVSPYISQQDQLDSPPPPRLSFYKQPWRGYLQTVPATQFLAGIGMNYSVPVGDHQPVLQLLSESGVRHIRVEIGWSEVPWEENQLTGHDDFVSIFRACKKLGIVPLILLNAHHGAPGPNQAVERTLVSGGASGSRAIVLDSVQDLTPARSGLSNLSDYKMCEAIFTDVNTGSRSVKLSKPLPQAIAPGSKVLINTFKYLPLYPVGTAQFNETLGGWLRYVDLAVGAVVESGIADFEVEIWNELAFGSDYLSINNYYEKPVASAERDFLQKGGQAWELGKQTVDRVKSKQPRARVIWGFANTDFYHTKIQDLPAGIDGQSYHPYGTNRQKIPDEFPPKDRSGLFVDGFIPRLNWCMPEGWAHLDTQQEQLIRGVLQPRVRTASLPATTRDFSHYMTEHGFVAKEAGLNDRDATQSYKAKALIRALTFWLNKGVAKVDIYTAYEESNSAAGILWSDPKPDALGGAKPALSPALAALKNLVAQFAEAEPLNEARQLAVNVFALAGQPEVFSGDSSHPPLYYREMFTFLPFQVQARRFVVATYVMSYDITAPPPPMSFKLEIKGVDGRRARPRYYDPIADRAVDINEDGRSDSSITLTTEQVEYPRLIILDDA